MHLSACNVTSQCRKHIGYKCIYTPLMPCDFLQGRVSCSRDLHSERFTEKEPVEGSEVIWLQVLFYLFHTLEHERCVSAGRECRVVRSACVCVCLRACLLVCLETRVVFFSPQPAHALLFTRHPHVIFLFFFNLTTCNLNWQPARFTCTVRKYIQTTWG